MIAPAAGDDDRASSRPTRDRAATPADRRSAQRRATELQLPHRRRRHEHQRRGLRARQRRGAGTRCIASRAPDFDALHRGAHGALPRSWRGRSPRTARAPPSCSRCRSSGAPTDGRSRRTSRKAIAGSRAREGGHLRRGSQLGPRARHRRARARARRSYAVDPYSRRGASSRASTVYDGAAPAHDDRAALKARMREPEVQIEVRLAGGRRPRPWPGAATSATTT